MSSKLVVLGGNGFVGQHVCRSAIKFGMDVVSVSRSGAPYTNQPWKGKVKWVKDDVGGEGEWKNELKDASAVVSCLGAFGSNDFMEKINGDLNIRAVSESLKSGVKRFVYISTVENTLPSFVLHGYFNGKRRAEEAVLDSFPSAGAVLRPGFMYGDRQVGTVSIPLGLLGKPLEYFLSLPGAGSLQNLPGMKAIFALPLPVESVGLVAAAAAMGKEGISLTGVLSIPDIKAAALMLDE